MLSKTGTWPYSSRELLYISDKDLKEIYKNYNLNDGTNYADHYIEYKKTVFGLIANCKEGQVILVHIHAGFPQQKEDFAIVYKDSDPYKRLIWTDDYNLVVDISEHFEILKSNVQTKRMGTYWNCKMERLSRI